MYSSDLHHCDYSRAQYCATISINFCNCIRARASGMSIWRNGAKMSATRIFLAPVKKTPAPEIRLGSARPASSVGKARPPYFIACVYTRVYYQKYHYYNYVILLLQSSELMHNKPKKRHSTIKGTTIIQIRINILQKVPCMFKDICALTCKSINDELLCCQTRVNTTTNGATI